TYAAGDEVLYQDYVYVSLLGANAGNNPLEEPSYWARKAPDLDEGTYEAGDQVWYRNVIWEATGPVTVTISGGVFDFDENDWTAIYKPGAFEVRFYRPGSFEAAPDSVTGLYPLVSGANPFVTYVVSNPTPSASEPDQLKVEEIRSGASVNVYHWTQTGNTWSYAEGGNLILTELTRSGAFDENAPVGTTRTERRKLKNGSGEVASDVLKTYEMFPWGEELISEAQDPEGVNRVTRYYYHDEDSGAPGYGRLKLRVGPFGNWDYWIYDADGRQIKTVSQFKNTSAPGGDTLPSSVDESSNRVVSHTFNEDADAGWNASLGELRRTVTYVQGNEVSRGYQIRYEEREIERIQGIDTEVKIVTYVDCTVPGAALGAASNLVTVERTIDEFDLKGQPFSIERPDGTMTRYSYSYDTSSSETMDWLVTTREEGTYVYTPLLEFEPFLREVTVVDGVGNLQSRESFRFDESGEPFTVDLEVVNGHDSETGRPTSIIYLDGTTRDMAYACCGLAWELSRDGEYTQYTYDDAGRVVEALKGDGLTSYDLDAAGRAVRTTFSKGSASTETTSTYNKAGELVSSMDVMGRITDRIKDTVTAAGETFVRERVSFPYLPGQAPVWATTTLSYQDGSLYQVSGPSTMARRYSYSSAVPGEEATTETFLKPDLSASGEYSTTVTDMLGRTRTVLQPALAPGGAGEAQTSYSYNALGQLVSMEDPTGVTTFYVYDDEGQLWKTYVGDDVEGPVQTTTISYGPASWDSGVRVRKTTSVSGDDVSGAQVTEVSLDDLTTVTTQYGLTATTVTALTPAVPVGGSGGYAPATRTVTTSIADAVGGFVSKTITVYADGQVVSSASYDAQGAMLDQTQYTYSDLGAPHTVSDAFGVTTYSYLANGRLESVTTPVAVEGSSLPGDQAQTTSYAYSDAPDGSMTRTITLPDGRIQTEEYYPDGQLKRRSGSRTYPVEYAYDYAGRMATMKTWQDYPSGVPVVTHWVYNARGLLQEKYYAYEVGNPGTPDLSYTYDDAGRLKTRTGGRGIVTAYSYDPDYGYQTGISYSDGKTPAISYTQYDRSGRIGAITDRTGTRTLVYGDGRIVSETYEADGEPWDGFAVERTFDAATRPNTVSLSDGTSPLHAVQYGFDGVTGRLETIGFSQGGQVHTAAYGYRPGSALVENVVQSRGAAEVLAVHRQYDNLGRLRSLSYGIPHQQLGMTYAYNAANQRTAATLGSGEYWLYGYDALGQVTSAAKYLPGAQPIPGYVFNYGFDDIGNRTQAGRDGNTTRRQVYYAGADATGTNGANPLNQYGSRSVPRVLGVLGSAHPAAEVTVNAETATRTGEYFQALLDYSGETSPNAARQESIAIQGTYSGQGSGGADAVAEAEASAYLPPNPENFIYDDDGNLSNDSRWVYTWDGENRLIAMEPTSVAAGLGVPNRKLVFTYDSQGRRMKKEVFDWDDVAGDWGSTPVETIAFLYDEWNVLAELAYDGAGTLASSRTYTWGPDLSGTLQGAGGVGGLLAVTAGADTYYPAYDGNGNVMAYVDSQSGTVSARFEYGPFGEPLRATGAAVAELNYRFSTKYTDPESGLLYYGYRYYDPVVGRWLSRDPIGEQGGVNLYAFVGNDGVNGWDYLGQISLGLKITGIWTSRVAETAFLSSIASRFFEDMPVYVLSDDEGEMRNMDSVVGTALMRYADANNLSGLIEVDNINLRDYYSEFVYYIDATTLGTGWWLNGAESVTATGTFCYLNNKIYVIVLSLQWNDTIDANPSGEPRKHQIEWLYKLHQDVYNLDFGVKIPWLIGPTVLQ
ncbi:RHS repeat-associated core domain-containing protein, partial [Ruficoccus amylovorans]|nr:RHS repeat-associated core domain-containing protein [Ruficoccus amylovorans]